MDDVYQEINERYEKEVKKNEKYDNKIKAIDEKHDKIFYESLKVGMISGISTYGIIRVIQKFT